MEAEKFRDDEPTQVTKLIGELDRRQRKTSQALRKLEKTVDEFREESVKRLSSVPPKRDTEPCGPPTTMREEAEETESARALNRLRLALRAFKARGEGDDV